MKSNIVPTRNMNQSMRGSSMFAASGELIFIVFTLEQLADQIGKPTNSPGRNGCCRSRWRHDGLTTKSGVTACHPNIALPGIAN